MDKIILSHSGRIDKVREELGFPSGTRSRVGKTHGADGQEDFGRRGPIGCEIGLNDAQTVRTGRQRARECEAVAHVIIVADSGADVPGDPELLLPDYRFVVRCPELDP